MAKIKLKFFARLGTWKSKTRMSGRTDFGSQISGDLGQVISLELEAEALFFIETEEKLTHFSYGHNFTDSLPPEAVLTTLIHPDSDVL